MGDREVQVKTCTACREVKPIHAFAKSKSGKHGVRSACKECTNSYNADYRLKNRETVNAASASWRAENKEHIRSYNKSYHEANYVPKPKKKYKTKKEADRQYYYLNRAAIISRAAKWNQDNREKSREHGRKTQQRKRLTGKGKLDDAMSSSIYQALQGTKAGRKWESLVGYTAEELMSHLTRQFQPGMTWENHGQHGWHIDHIIPRSAFNYEKPEDIDFKRCWALENLQPLWWQDNLSKGAKLTKPFQPSLALAVNDNQPLQARGNDTWRN